MCGCCFVWYISKILEWHNVVFLCTLLLFPSCYTKKWGSGILQKKVRATIHKWKYYLKVGEKHSIMPWLLIACLVCFHSMYFPELPIRLAWAYHHWRKLGIHCGWKCNNWKNSQYEIISSIQMEVIFVIVTKCFQS